MKSMRCIILQQHAWHYSFQNGRVRPCETNVGLQQSRLATRWGMVKFRGFSQRGGGLTRKYLGCRITAEHVQVLCIQGDGTIVIIRECQSTHPPSFLQVQNTHAAPRSRNIASSSPQIQVQGPCKIQQARASHNWDATNAGGKEDYAGSKVSFSHATTNQ